MTNFEHIIRAVQHEAGIARNAAATLRSELEPVLVALGHTAREVRALSAQYLKQLEELARQIRLAEQHRAEEEPRLRELYGLLASGGWVGLEHYPCSSDTATLIADIERNGPEWLEQEICSDFRRDDGALLKEVVSGWWTILLLDVFARIALEKPRANP